MKSLGVYVKGPSGPESDTLAGRFVPQALSRLDVQLREGGTLQMSSAYDLESFRWQVEVKTVVHVVP